jgi:hypothetical protein
LYLLGVNHEGGVGGESFKALLAISWVEEYGKFDDLFDRYIYEFNFVAFFIFFFFLRRYATQSKAFSKVTLFPQSSSLLQLNTHQAVGRIFKGVKW